MKTAYPRDVNTLRRRISVAMAHNEFAPEMLAELMAIVIFTMNEFDDGQKQKVLNAIDTVRVYKGQF
jgi:hypothetical protein